MHGQVFIMYKPESNESSGLLVSSSVQLGLGSEGPGSTSGVSPEGRGISLGATERLSPPKGVCLTSGGIKLLTFSRVAESEIYIKHFYFLFSFYFIFFML